MLDQLLKWIMMISVLASWVPFGKPGPSAYMALLPARMISGEQQAVSLSLWNGCKPASGQVEVSLWQDGERVAGQQRLISGKGRVEFQVPSQPGEYEVKVSGPGFSDETTVEVVEGALIFLETDKPIYKPGQAIQARIISLDSEIRQATTSVLRALQSALNIPNRIPPADYGVVDKSEFSEGGIFSHFHVDYKGQGKWDVAPWWDSIIEDIHRHC